MKIKMIAAAALITLGWVPGAQAIEIDGTEVGQIDELECGIDSDKSGQGYEEQLIYDCTGLNVNLVENIDISDGSLISEGEYNAIDVNPAEPGVFLLKFGAPNGSIDMFVFTNLADLGYLVWTDSQLIDEGLPESHVQSISHYTYGGGTTTVPEPTTLSLFALGLLGLGGAMNRRRRLS